MNSKQTIKKILIALFIAIAVLIAYSIFVGSEDGGPQGSLSSLLGTSTTGQISEQKSVLANAEILRILGSIQTISLDDDIFANPVFYELRDSNFRISSASEPGRPNPFLPIGFDAISQFIEAQEEAQSQVSSFFN